MTGIFSYLLGSDSTFLMIITALIVAPLVLLFVMFKSRNHKPLNLPPGSYGWPLLGETLAFLSAGLDGFPEKFVKERCEKYNSDVFKTSILGENFAVLCGPAGNKFLFSNENKLVTVWWPKSVKNLLGPCIATNGGMEGMLMKKMVSYFVSPDALTKLYFKTMELASQQHLNTHWKDVKELKVFPIMRLYMFELGCRSFMSIHESTQIAKLSAPFGVFIHGVLSIPIDLPGTKFFKAKRATNDIKKQLQVIVRQRRVDLELKKASPSQDLLSHLIAVPDENGKFMSEEIIINNIFMLLFAGHDTSSSALTLLIKNLAQLPEVYEKVLKEHTGISSSKETGEILEWEDIKKMKYSWNVVSETLRLAPPVTGSYREALTDLKFGGYDIPKGWKLYWNASMTHTDNTFFKDPYKFDPSRFEGSGPAIPYSYVAFGGGPRMCLGKEFARLEILIFLHNLIKRFRWNLVFPDEKIIFDPFPNSVKGLAIRLQPRQAQVP